MSSGIGLGWIDAGTVAFIGQNFGATIRKEVHDDSQELLNLLYYRIEARTPKSSGALAASLDGENFTDPSTDDLVSFLYLDQPQIDQYGRVYAMYQEGGPLGLATYTNAPHEMLYKVQTDDAPLVNAWIKGSVEAAIAKILAAQGIRL